MRRFLTILAAVAAFSLTAQAEWSKLEGQKAPKISVEEWLNAGKSGPEASDLKGKVMLLEFFATW